MTKSMAGLRVVGVVPRHHVDAQVGEEARVRLLRARDVGVVLPPVHARDEDVDPGTQAAHVGGDEIMALLEIGPGPRVGEVKRALLELVTDEPASNTPETLRRVVRERWGSGGPRGD